MCWRSGRQSMAPRVWRRRRCGASSIASKQKLTRRSSPTKRTTREQDAARWRAGARLAGAIGAYQCQELRARRHVLVSCRYGAKQSALQVYLPRARTAGARILTDATVARIVVTSRDTGQGSRRRSASTRADVTLLPRAKCSSTPRSSCSRPAPCQRRSFAALGTGRRRRGTLSAAAPYHGAPGPHA